MFVCDIRHFNSKKTIKQISRKNHVTIFYTVQYKLDIFLDSKMSRFVYKRAKDWTGWSKLERQP